MWGTYTVAVVRQPTEEQRERWTDQGDLIRRVREKKQMSQAALGRALDLSPKTVIQIEKGRRQLNQQEMDVLIRVLGLSARAFFDPPRRGQKVETPLENYLAESHIAQAQPEVAKAEADLARQRAADTLPPQSVDPDESGAERQGSREGGRG